MTTSTITARRKGDPQHYVEGKRKDGHRFKHSFQPGHTNERKRWYEWMSNFGKIYIGKIGFVEMYCFLWNYYEKITSCETILLNYYYFIVQKIASKTMFLIFQHMWIKCKGHQQQYICARTAWTRKMPTTVRDKTQKHSPKSMNAPASDADHMRVYDLLHSVVIRTDSCQISFDIYKDKDHKYTKLTNIWFI